MKRNSLWILPALGLVVLGAAFGVSRFIGAENARAPLGPPAGVLAAESITVYKGPGCQCCGEWAEHLREHGFEVEEEVVDGIFAFIEERGIPRHLLSCHMGVVDDYVVVGHVPADLVWRLLDERLEVSGISVPDMPLGSPGMEEFSRGQKAPYDVIAFGPDGEFVYDSR